MEILSNYVIVFSLTISAMLFIALINANRITVVNYTEVDSYKILFFKYKVTRIKSRSFKNGQPIGEAIVLSKQKEIEIDQKSLKDTLNLISAPAIKIALKAILPH